MKMRFVSTRQTSEPIPVTVTTQPAPEPFAWQLETWPKREPLPADDEPEDDDA